MRNLLSGTASLEEVFVEVDIDTFRTAFREAQDVPEKIPSKLSSMPEDLLNGLNREQILDLLAYMQAGGNPTSPLFK